MPPTSNFPDRHDSFVYEHTPLEPNFIRDLAARNMLQLTLSRSTDVEGEGSGQGEGSTSTILVIKGRGFDVEQFEAGVRRRFEKLNEQLFGRDVVVDDAGAGVRAGTGGEDAGVVKLDHLYETISVMSGAFVESSRGGNVSAPRV